MVESPLHKNWNGHQVTHEKNIVKLNNLSHLCTRTLANYSMFMYKNSWFFKKET